MNTSENCIRHQDRKAHWICPKCESGYCPACVSKRSSGLYRKKAKYFCPKCNIPAEWVGASNLIPPFWKRLHNFFTYPIARGPLLLIFVCAGLCSLPSILGPLGFLFNLLGWGLSLKYAFEILRATSRGKLVPPKIDMKIPQGTMEQVRRTSSKVSTFSPVGGRLRVGRGSHLWSSGFPTAERRALLCGAESPARTSSRSLLHCRRGVRSNMRTRQSGPRRCETDFPFFLFSPNMCRSLKEGPPTEGRCSTELGRSSVPRMRKGFMITGKYIGKNPFF